MGYKLGKMVNKFFLSLALIFCVIVSSNNDINLKRVDGLSKEILLGSKAQIYSLLGSNNNIELKEIKIAQPNRDSLKLLKLLTPRDKYAIRVLDDKNKEIMLIGIGNPFYIHADHIGYEDRDVFGGYIETELNLPLSINTKPSKIILLSQDEFGLKEIKRLDLN
jgi:hypothetical protein